MSKIRPLIFAFACCSILGIITHPKVLRFAKQIPIQEVHAASKTPDSVPAQVKLSVAPAAPATPQTGTLSSGYIRLDAVGKKPCYNLDCATRKVVTVGPLPPGAVITAETFYSTCGGSEGEHAARPISIGTDIGWTFTEPVRDFIVTTKNAKGEDIQQRYRQTVTFNRHDSIARYVALDVTYIIPSA